MDNVLGDQNELESEEEGHITMEEMDISVIGGCSYQCDCSVCYYGGFSL